MRRISTDVSCGSQLRKKVLTPYDLWCGVAQHLCSETMEAIQGATLLCPRIRVFLVISRNYLRYSPVSFPFFAAIRG